MINFIFFHGILIVLEEKLNGWSKTDIEDFIPDYCKRGERLNSNLLKQIVNVFKDRNELGKVPENFQGEVNQ